MAKTFGFFLTCVCLFSVLITINKATAEQFGTAICEQYLKDKNIISRITNMKNGSTPCACVENDIAHDAMFEKRGDCYDEWLFNDGVRQRCCYSENGKLLTGYPNGGFNILDGIGHSMDAVYESCCHGNNNYSCKAFYEINTSDDCKRYKEPMSALSWGDPVIQTVGIPSYNYSFNGHGEYVFLKSQQGLEIQARLDYLVPGNNDSTIFTAFVFTYKSESIQVTFNRSKTFLALYLSDGKLWKTTDECSIEQKLVLKIGIVLKCLAGFKLIQSETAVDITTDGTFMNIKVAHSEKLSNMLGLAGNVRSDAMFVGQNGTLYPLNSSEHDMFEYGESWSIRRDESLSHFIYNVTGGNFDGYNTYSEPKFLEKFLNNFTALFVSCKETDLATINSTCKNTWENVFNRECLLTIARTCNISLGEAIHHEVEKQHKEFLFRTNKAPSFKNTMPNNTYMLFNGNSSWSINLTEMVIDDSMIDLRFTVEPMLNNEMKFGDDGVFKWTVGTAFRNISARTLRFQVFDELNWTEAHTVTFRYCGCDQPSECKFQRDTDDNAECACPNRFVKGQFCENKIDPCSQYVCDKNDTCNRNYSGDDSPCAECPKKGFYEEHIGFTQYCRDLNECNDTRTHNCSQECFDDVGSYHCGCRSGYLLNNDNSTCADEDECVLGNYSCPNPHEACVNIPGTYKCGCESGYSKNNDTAPCVKLDSQMYFGYLEYISPTNTIPQTNDSLQSGIATTSTEFTRILNNATNFTKIEIYRIYKRADVAGSLVHFDFVVHMNSKRGRQDIMKDMGGILNQHQQIELSASPQLTLNPPLKVFLVQEPDAGGICDVVPKRSDCLEQSTHCVNREIEKDYYDCECNAGFKKPITGKKRNVYCNDVNECELFKSNNTTGERCVHGLFCSNTYGSWNCTCPTDRLWMSVGTTEDPIYRCQGNHSYLGNITFIWDASKEQLNQSIIVSFLKAEINKKIMDPSLDAERKTAVPITSLLVSVTVLSNTSFIPPPFGDSYMMTYEFRIRIGDPISTKRLQDIAHDGFKTNTVVGPASFQNMTIFDESDNELCKRTNNGSCDMRTTVCVQANGTTNCKCRPGYNMHPGDSHACQDVDECNSGYTCNGGTCENTEGNWTCKCPLETSRVVLNETVQTCSAAAFNMCTSMETPYRLFTCDNGKRICENSTLSCRCGPGYIVRGKGINSTCTDLDECSNYPCGNGTCVNTEGAYSCHCNKGFKLNTNETTCIDIDECLHPDDICVNGICTNNNGSYTCTCLNGYYEQFSNPYVTFCTDINECANASYSCDGTCTNQPGSFTCACPSGYKNYTSEDNHMHFMCKDFNECANPSVYQCINGTCNNTNGSWDCLCGVSSQPLKLNNSVVQCIDIYRYSMQFEVQEISLPGGSHPTDKEIKGLFIKQVTDILNTSQALGGKVLFPVELLPDGYHHPSFGNITINVTVILSTVSNDSALQTVFEKSNSTQRTIVAGNILVISLSRKDIFVDQCNLHSQECDYNTTVCVFDKSKGRVSCDCRTAYKGLEYRQGVGICEPKKESKEEFAYVATVNFTIQVNKNIDNTTLKEMVKLQITSMYQAMFPFDKIWVEIVKLFGEHIRRKRDTPTKVPIQYIIHTNESKNETDFTEAWKNCTNINSSCHDRIQNHSNTSFVMSYDSPVFDTQTEFCIISNVCDKNTTTCNITSTKVVCSCKAGYVNIIFYNDTSDSFYTCELPADHPVVTTTMTSTTYTTTTSSEPAYSSTIVPQGYPTTQRANMTTSSSSASSETGKTGSPPNTVTTFAVETDRPVTSGTVAPKAETTTKSKEDVGVKKDDKPESSSNTALIATGASLGIVVLIVMITIIVVCRLRSKKAQDTERIKLRELEKERKNGFDNSLLGRHYLRSDSKQNSVNDLSETDRDDKRNSYYGGPFKPIEPTYTRPFKAVDPEPIWDRNGHEPGLKGRSGSLPDINGHVDMRMAPETRRMSHPRTSDPLYSSPTQKPVDNYRQNMVRVFPESGERLPRAKTNQFPNKPANGRISPKPDYYDDPPRSPKPDYNGKRPRDRFDASHDSGLNGYSRSSGSPEAQRSRESNGYGSLRRGRYRMEDTPF